MISKSPKTTATPERPCVLIERASDRDGHGIDEDQLAASVAARGFDVLLCPPLYHLPEDDPVWAALGMLRSLAAVFGRLHPRPMSRLLSRHGIDGGLPTLDLREFSTVDNALQALIGSLPEEIVTGAPGAVTEVGSAAVASEERWYPVVDEERCVNCQHCLQFCLFGVYELDAEGRVRVTQPDNCKHGCPACARICPQSAIMFPLYDKDRAISGAPGEFVELDAAAKRMFYARTEQQCPVCGQDGPVKRDGSAGGGKCPECGRPLAVAAGAEEPRSAALDEIDALIDQLDRMTQGD